jgi:hypothetical protein
MAESYNYAENSTGDVGDVGNGNGWQISSYQGDGSIFNPTGVDGSKFNIDTTGKLTFKVAPDFETPTDSNTNNIYSFYVSRNGNSDDREYVQVTVTDVNEAPHSLVASTTVAVPENTAITANTVVSTFSFSDDALGTETVTLTGTDAALFSILRNGNLGTVVWAANTTPNFEVKSAYNVGISVKDAALVNSTALTKDLSFNVTNVNEKPVLGAITDKTVNENSAAGVAIAAALATDPDAGAVLTYALANNFGGRFAINATTGAITTGAVALDFEVQPSYALQVTANDGSLTSNVVSFNVGVTNVNDKPVVGAIADKTVNENSAAGVAIAAALATDQDAGAVVTYALANNFGGRFVINSATGAITTGATPLDFEAQPSYALQVTANDGLLTSDVVSFNVGVTNVNEKPVVGAIADKTVDENSAAGVAIAAALATDPDAGAVVTYALANDYGGRFAIDTATGAITTGAVALDFETQPSYALQVTANDGSLTSDVVSFNVGVNNVNEKPVVGAITDKTIDENSAAGVAIAAALATDPDAGAVLTYALANDFGGRFVIDTATGAITTGAVALDFEGQSSYALQVTANDGSLTSDVVSFNVGVNDVNEKPVLGAIADKTVNENSAAGVAIAAALATDPDAGAVLTYALSNDFGGRFVIDTATGAITTGAVALDFEGQSSYALQVTANDGSLTSDVVSFNVGVNDVNEKPVLGAIADKTVNENSAAGVAIAAALATDPDAGAVLTYALSNDFGGRFVIDTATGAITTGAVALDFEGQSSYALQVTANDGSLTSDVVSFNFGVNDVNEKPVLGAIADKTVNENSAAGVAIAAALATDPDAGAVLTYALSNDFGGRFVIDTATGAITTGAVALDFEGQSSYALQVTANDGSLTSDVVSFNVGVTNVNEKPVVGAITDKTVDENSAAGVAIAAALATDPDAGAMVTYALANDYGGRFVIDTATGAITTGAVALDFEGQSSYALQVTANDGSLTSDVVSFNVGVNDVNEKPVLGAIADKTVNENSAAGVAIAAALATDPDAGAVLTYALSNDFGGRFVIDTATGAITTGGVALDFETQPSYALQVTANDGSLTSGPIGFNVTVNDVAEGGGGGGGGVPTPAPEVNNDPDGNGFDGGIAALVVANFINGATPATAAKLAALTAFADAQYNAYAAARVLNPALGPFEALGRGLSETTEFTTKYGAQTEGAFITSVYKSVFGTDATASQQKHFQTQIDYFEAIYESVNISSEKADLFAKGAVLGQMLGIATLEGPSAEPFLAEANAFLVDAADGTVAFGRPLSHWDVV